MRQLDKYVEREKKGLFFSGINAAEHLAAFLDRSEAPCRSLAKEVRDDIEHIYLVGSGGSWANLQTIKYIFDGLMPIPVEVVPSYELLWRKPVALGPKSLTFFASYSGETEDTLAALRFAASRGVRTVALVQKADTTIGREADTVMAYETPIIYEAPMSALLLFGGFLARGTAHEQKGEEIIAGLKKIPQALATVVPKEGERAEALAREFLPSNHITVLGAGALSPLAYKLAMTVVMEMLRIGGTYCDACEFRHGPVEALERTHMDMMFLIGTDDSREMTLRSLDFCRAHGAHVMIYDGAEFGDVHPLLVPLVMNSAVQWFIVYSAGLRGISDLHDRVYMGQGVLAENGALWP